MYNNYEVKISLDWKVSSKYNVYLAFRDKYERQSGDGTLKRMKASLDKSSSAIYATYTRLTRNTVTHPNEIIMDRMKVLMFFITFVDYCELQYNFINYFKANS